MVLAVKGLTAFVPKKPMKPGMYVAPPSAAPAAPAAPTDQKLADGTPARLRLTADKGTLPDDGTEIRVTVAVLDAAGKSIGNSVKGKVAITAGRGLFPTGQTFDFTTRNGQDSIEFRSYDRGKVVLTASSPGLEPAELEITVVGAPQP
jgi:hypothetical protein